MSEQKYTGRRAVFMVVTATEIFHSLEGPRSDDKCKLTYQTEHLFIYVIDRSGGTLKDRREQVANAAMTLTQALGDEISSMRDLTARKATTRKNKQVKKANDLTEWMF